LEPPTLPTPDEEQSLIVVEPTQQLLLIKLLLVMLLLLLVVDEQHNELSMIERSYTDSDIFPIIELFSINNWTTILSSFMYKSFTLFILV
jgi:hypothetical protein